MKEKTPCQNVADLVSSCPESAENLPPDLVDHIEKCALCEVEVRASRRLMSMLDSFHRDYSPGVSPGEIAERAMAGKPSRKEEGQGIWTLLKRPLFWAPAGIAAAAAIAAAAFLMIRQPSETEERQETKQRLAALSCISIANTGETFPRDCHPEDPDVLSTGHAERLQATLSDGTVVRLNHSSRMKLDKEHPRSLRLSKGESLIETAKREDLPSLMVNLPTGSVEVVGTKLHVKAMGEYSFVDVVQGKVIVESGGQKESLLAGGEAVLEEGNKPIIRAASDLGVALEWVDETHGPEEGTSGFGTLTARRPGSTDDDDQALRLVDHKVNVSVRGRMVRTEIEEEFHNDTNHVMEGIYTFPMPTDARIAALDLVVDGEWMHGAMVERKRGEKIWRGVIRQGTPRKQRQKREEFVWVPGPWEDPALLKWQQGNQFELRIYPIPKKGSRRVRIAYTQIMRPVPGGRRYVLPLAADPSGRPRTEKFDLRMTIGGLSDHRELRISPYKLDAWKKKDGVVLHMERNDFAPTGDIVVDIPDRYPTREVHAYSYKDPTGEEDGFALLSLRPQIPYEIAATSLNVLFVVDSSYSIQKARINRAAEMIGTLTREIGLESRVAVMSCATRCTPLTQGFIRATGENAALLEKKVKSLEPLGSSRLAAAFEDGVSFLAESGAENRNSRIIYLGNGIPSAGEIETDRLAGRVKKTLGEIRLTTVSLGGNVDELNMRAMADAGGGAFVDFPAGANPRSIAFTVMQRQKGEPLRGAGLLLPPGVVRAAPSKLGEVWPGEERLVAVRVSKDTKGEVVLTGMLHGEPFERRYRISFQPRPHEGNSFIPRLWAEMRINELEKKSGRADREEVVELSRRYHVLSRHTSLLVLESEAMAQAFGVEDTRPAVEWTGDSDMQEEDAVVESPDILEAGGGIRRSKRARPAPAARERRQFFPSDDTHGALVSPQASAIVRSPARRMVRMRRVWYRVADITGHDGPIESDEQRLKELRAAFEQNPHSRDRTRDLLRWYVRMGKLDKAEETALHWLKKDRLDPGALVELAGIRLLKGQAHMSRELLASAVDVDPRSIEAHTRMFELYEAADDKTLMCDHALTRAFVDPQNLEHAVAAVRCNDDKNRHFADLSARDQKRAEKELQKKETPSLRGRLVIESDWRGNRNVDIVVITPRGRVVSWMGGERRVQSRNVLSTERETLASSMRERGFYQVVMVPAADDDHGRSAINGTVRIRSYDSRRTLPFSSNGEPVRLARIRVQSRSKLVPAPLVRPKHRPEQNPLHGLR